MKNKWLNVISVWFKLAVIKHTAAQDDNRVTMKGQAIPRVKAHNHLGLKVTSTLSWSEHISRTRANAPSEWVWSGKFIIFSRKTFWKGFMQLKFVPLWNTGARFGAEITVQGFRSYRTVSAEKIKLSFRQDKQDSITWHFVAILQDEKHASSRLRIYNAYCLKLALLRHTIICAVINSRYQQWGRPVHWRLFFDRSFCGMTCPQTFMHRESLHHLKLLLRFT